MRQGETKERTKGKRKGGPKGAQLTPLVKLQGGASVNDDDKATVELREAFEQLCASGDSMPSLPHPSIALSSALMQHGKAYWRQVALRVVSQLKAATDNVQPRVHGARLLLLFYMSCDAWCGPMLILEGIVPTLVRECYRHHAVTDGSSAIAPGTGTDDSPRRLPALPAELHHGPPSHHCLDVAVDWFRYTNRALCQDLVHHDQLDLVLPIGAQSMLCLLGNSSLPQNEVDEFDSKTELVPATHSTPRSSPPLSIFGFAPSVGSIKRDHVSHPFDAATSLANQVATDPSFHLHLAVRTLVCLVHVARGLERRRLLADGAAHVLATLATASPALPIEPTGLGNNDQTRCYPPFLARVLDRSFVQRMARSGVASISMEELRRSLGDASLQLLKPVEHCHASLDAIILERVLSLERRDAEKRRRQHADAIVRDPAKSLEARLGSVTTASDLTRPRFPQPDKRMTKAQVVQWMRHTDAVTRHLLRSLAVLHSASATGSKSPTTLKGWLAHVDQERMAAAAVEALQARELDLMKMEDKPPETEADRKARLQAKAQQVERADAERRLANELQVRRVRDAKAEQLARQDMTKEDRYIRRAVKTEQELEAEAVAAEATRVAALRVQVRERRVRDVEERQMREEDARARQVRRQQWDLEEAAFRRQRGQEADETHHMREEDVQMHKMWPLIDAAEEERQFQAKLAKKKEERAAARRQRRQAEHPELYAKEWEAVDLNDGTGRYYRNVVTGDVQWTDPCQKPVWDPVVDDQGRTYYYNAATGESAWALPADVAATTPIAATSDDAWEEFETDDGVKYYVHRTTGESVWEKPVWST